MRIPLLIIVVYFVFLLSIPGRGGKGHSRRKRSLVGLAGMIQWATGRNPLDFVGYGNWCGLGGGGPTVDNIDGCCKSHDKCYNKATDKVCFDRKPHLSRYEWTDYKGKIYCSKRNDDCSSFSCHCDRIFAYCVRLYETSYDSCHKKRKSRLLKIVFE